MGLFSRKKWEDLGIPVKEDELRNIWSIYNPRHMDIRDTHFRAIPRKDFEYLLEMKREPEPKYADQKFDCDDFVVSCQRDLHLAWADLADTSEALAFGYASGLIEKKEDSQIVYGGHAWVWQLTDELDLVFYDAQTNKRMKERVVEVYNVTT